MANRLLDWRAELRDWVLQWEKWLKPKFFIEWLMHMVWWWSNLGFSKQILILAISSSWKVRLFMIQDCARNCTEITQYEVCIFVYLSLFDEKGTHSSFGCCDSYMYVATHTCMLSSQEYNNYKLLLGACADYRDADPPKFLSWYSLHPTCINSFARCWFEGNTLASCWTWSWSFYLDNRTDLSECAHDKDMV